MKFDVQLVPFSAAWDVPEIKMYLKYVVMETVEILLNFVCAEILHSLKPMLYLINSERYTKKSTGS